MLAEIDIYKSIKQTLETEFPEIKVQINDIKNPQPPCFYIKFVNSKFVQSAKEFETATISFDVNYFSKEQTLQDLLSVQNKLRRLFQSPLKVTKEESPNIYFVEINETVTSINEEKYILICTIEIELVQRLEKDLHDRYLFPDGYNGIPNDSSEAMEELILNLKKQGE